MATKPREAVKIIKGKIFHTGWGYKKQTQSVKNTFFCFDGFPKTKYMRYWWEDVAVGSKVSLNINPFSNQFPYFYSFL